MAVPAWEMASNAYSTWYKRPSGEKMVVYNSIGQLPCPTLATTPPAIGCLDLVDLLKLQQRLDLPGNRIFSTWRLAWRNSLSAGLSSGKTGRRAAGWRVVYLVLWSVIVYGKPTEWRVNAGADDVLLRCGPGWSSSRQALTRVACSLPCTSGGLLGRWGR